MQLSCSFCGRVCSDNDNFCAGCGARLGSRPERQPALPVPVHTIEPVLRRQGGVQPALKRAGQVLRRVTASPAAREVAKAAVPLAAYVGYRLLERALEGASRPAPPSLEAATPRRGLTVRPSLPAATEPAPMPLPARCIVRETVVISRQVVVRST